MKDRAGAKDFGAVLGMAPVDLLDWLAGEFTVELPEEVITVEDMNRAAKLLMKLSSYYSYLCVLYSHAKIASRMAKRSGDKEAYEDSVDRKEIIEKMTDSVKQSYAAVSRSVTIKIENNQELRMNANGGISASR